MSLTLKVGTTDRLILKALLNSERVTANDGFKYLTTRVSNSILKLRKLGLKIDNKYLKSSRNKVYANYVLNQDEINLAKASKILEQSRAL